MNNLHKYYFNNTLIFILHLYILIMIYKQHVQKNKKIKKNYTPTAIIKQNINNFKKDLKNELRKKN